MVFRKIFGKKPHKSKKAPAVMEKAGKTASHRPPPGTHDILESAIASLAAQEHAHKRAAAEDQAKQAQAELASLKDFRIAKETVIIPVFNDTIAFFEKHGGKAHIGKSIEENWAGESVRLNLFSRAEFRGPVISFSLPDQRHRTMRVTKTIIESTVKDLPLDHVDAAGIRREIALFIEDIRKHRQK